MTVIVRLIDALDFELAAAWKAGFVPAYFLIDAEGWLEVAERFRGLPGNPVNLPSHTYRGVQVYHPAAGEAASVHVIVQ